LRLTERTLLAKDLIRALLVMALVCLNFTGHDHGLAVAYGEDLTPYVVADGTIPVLCAQDVDGDRGPHAPCHACRIGFDLDLPPAPSCAEPAFLAVAGVRYEASATGTARQILRPAHSARGPPLA